MKHLYEKAQFSCTSFILTVTQHYLPGPTIQATLHSNTKEDLYSRSLQYDYPYKFSDIGYQRVLGVHAGPTRASFASCSECVVGSIPRQSWGKKHLHALRPLVDYSGVLLLPLLCEET